MKIDTATFPPTIETERLILRPLELTDAAAIFEYASCPENTKYMFWDTQTSEKDAEEFIRCVQKGYEEKTCHDYAFILKDENKLIGTGGVFKASENLAHRAEIGYILNQKYWGRGLATEAMRGVIAMLKKVYGTHRIEANHFEGNPASGRVMQKLGMTFEGTQVDKLFIRGEYVSLCAYALVRVATDQK